MKAILVVDIPDDIWANKEEDMGMYAEVWSKRIDDGWCGEYYADSLKPMPERLKYSIKDVEQIAYTKIGFNACLNLFDGSLEEALETLSKYDEENDI